MNRLPKGLKILGLFALIFSPPELFSQNAYFIDGYHGGIYGHYPNQYTKFLVDVFKKNPDWKISLEIEPETWDTVKIKEPEAYIAFRDLVLNPSTRNRIEFTNPAYGQGYLYNISGESVIRQFTFGMERLQKHFPGLDFTTYSVEEPCFTSCLPQVLKSLGFKYAVIRCPNTCWGGYPAGFGGELVNWVGPDGTRLISVPRYECEGFQENSVWQTESWNNSVGFIKKCFASGIKNPAGMTYQDAGWKGGPWLGNAVKSYYMPSISETWRNYIENVSVKVPSEDWNFSQEDLRLSLVWGSQVLQKIAQQVRAAENRLVSAEKLASIAGLYSGYPWPDKDFDEGWRTLLLAQHHDCWIVPYNGRPGNTWADKVSAWTGTTLSLSDASIQKSVNKLSQSTGKSDQFCYVRAFNTAGNSRNEIIMADMPSGWDTEVKVTDSRNKEILSQVLTDSLSGTKRILFKAEVPAMGYNTFRFQKSEHSIVKGASVTVQSDGTFKIETDLYQIIIDASKGGTISSLIAKSLKNREFVDRSHERSFNELRGNFFREGGFCSSVQNPAKISILENGPAVVSLEIKGSISVHPFKQIITVAQGQRRIDMSVKIDWKGNPGIGDEYSQAVKWQQEERRKAFYNNRDKLLALFPLNLQSQRVYVNAPFDVTESRLEDTFFTRWDSIKNDIVLNWIDVTDSDDKYGMAIFTDHTTSYSHGKDFPAGLTIQYSGIGLWGRNYNINGPTEINYALIPHIGKWDKSGIWTESIFRNEPLIAKILDSAPSPENMNRSFTDITGTGYEISSLVSDGNDLLVRVFNAEGDDSPRKLSFDGNAERVQLVELNGRMSGELKTEKGKPSTTVVNLAIPRFGIRTLRLVNILKK